MNPSSFEVFEQRREDQMITRAMARSLARLKACACEFEDVVQLA
jgi:hypothetical protein